MTIVPVLFFLLVEAGLRVCGYGYPTAFFVKIDDRDAYTTNQQFGWRFFPSAIARKPQLCELSSPKPPHTYRIFVLGGSAAMGTPDPAFAFGRMLETMLEEAYPETEFEVVNGAMTAINSHVVLPIARDCADHEPDLFAVYLGNNEVVGPFGSGTVFQGYSPSLSLIRTSVFLKTTKIGQLIGDLAGGGDDAPKQWKGMELFGDRVAADDPRMENVYGHFRENLRDICDLALASEAEIVVCTVATNLKDSAPFAAEHGAGLTEADQATWTEHYESGIALAEAGEHATAVEAFRKAVAVDDRHAELRFRLAQALAAVERLDEAREHFVAARDLDTLRFRADTRINEIIREVARADSESGVRLADVERAFEQSDRTEARIPGGELFYEHVHLTPEGNYLLARTVFAEVVAALPDSIRGDPPQPAAPILPSCCFELIALTDWDRYRMESDIAKMESRPPFTNQLDHDRRRSLRRQRLAALREQGMSPVALADARKCYEAAVERNEDNLEFRQHFAHLLFECGDYRAAAQQWRGLLERFPGEAGWHIEVGTALMADGKADDAIAEFERAMAADAGLTASAHFNIGTLRLEQSDLEKAAKRFRLALQAEPDMAEAHVSLGAVRLQQGNLQYAVDGFRRALEIDPNLARAHHNLGLVLARQDNLDEAVEHFRRATKADPAHLLTYPALASALAKQGKPAEAMQQYRDAVTAAPDNAEAHYRLANMLITRSGPRQAIPEFREAVRLDPGHVRAGHNLAMALFQLGQTDEAIAQYRSVLKAEAGYGPSLNELARILAMHPDASFRNGTEALSLMQDACKQTHRDDPAYLDTLAAAYAESGRFDDAMKVAQAALELAETESNRPLASILKRHLALYRQQKPVRDLPGVRPQP